MRYSLAAHLASVNPALALRLDADNPKALLALAGDRVSAVSQARSQASRVPAFAASPALASLDGDASARPSETSLATLQAQSQLLAEARDMAMRARKAEPLNYRAETLLGHIAELSESTSARVTARAHYERTARLSLRASDAIFWLMRADLEAGDHARALARADILLRTTSRAPQAVFPVVAHLLETPAASAAVTELLAADPPWRDSFLAELPRLAADPSTPLTLLLALKQSPRPPATASLRFYLNQLLARGQHELAYYTWLQFLPQEQLAAAGLLFNGSFETKPSGLPFDWAYRSGRGTVIDILPLPDRPEERGLRIDFTDGRVDFGGVSQITYIAPGRYTLAGRYRGNLEGTRGLRWRVSCAGPAPLLLAQSPMQLGLVPVWRELTLDFAIPDSKCEAQRVHLDLDARSASELLIRGTIWYDGLRIARQKADAPSR